MTSYLEQVALEVYASTTGQPVSKGDAAPWLTPLEISRTSGGRQLDYVVFDYNLGYTGEHIENLMTPLDFSSEVAIWATINGLPTPVFWGELTQQNVEIRSAERVTVTAQIMPYHFGDVAEGVTVVNNLGPGKEVRMKQDIEFNPLVDGEIVDNQSKEKGDSGNATNTHFLWLDPESVKTSSALSQNAPSGREAWTLKEAINSLCFEFNWQEEFIKNPTLSDATLFDDAPEVRDVRLKRGLHLPDYLDALLLPLGYDWYVKLTAKNDTIERRIEIFRRTKGTEKTLKIAPIGDEADFATTNTDYISVTTDIGVTINKIVAYGAFQRREITVELKRAWNEENDEEFPIYSDEGILSKPNVWRRFVANEAGDWNGIRPDTTTLDLSDIFDTDEYYPRRRKFLTPLTVKPPQNTQLEIFVEYYNGTDWNALPDEHVGEVKILEDEMGIYFAGATPPKTLYDIGDDLQVRVTGTVVGDKRVFAEAEDADESPNARTSTLFLDLSDRFVDNQVVQSGSFASQLFVGANLTTSIAQDDSDAIQDYVDALLANEKAAAMKCDFQLMGLNANYGIGDLLTKIEGRNIDLNRNTELSLTKRYPQIVGVVYRPQDPSTILVVDTNEGF